MKESDNLKVKGKSKMPNDILNTKYEEESLLGGLIKNPSAIPEVSGIITGECFTNSDVRTLYEFLLWMNENHDEWDTGNLHTELKSQNKFTLIGGGEMLVKVLECASFNPMFEARKLAEAKMRRGVLAYSVNLQQQACNTVELPELLSHAQNDLDEVLALDDVSMSSSMQTMAEALSDLKMQGVDEFEPTGLPPLDEFIHGFGKGHFVILAGRPAMGKTSFMMTLIKSMLNRDIPCAMFSLEMTKDDLFRRLLYSDASVPMSLCYQGQLTEVHEYALKLAKEKYIKKPFVIDTTRNLDPNVLRSRIYALKRKHGIKAVFIDYLQLMDCGKKGGGSRYEEVTHLSNKLKTIALDMDVPIVCACQLSRAVESRTDKTPRMHDLRDSGAIEQDADLIMMLHRPSYYLTPEMIDKAHGNGEVIDYDHAEVHIAKNRRGACGVLNAEFKALYCQYDLLFQRWSVYISNSKRESEVTVEN